MFKKPVIIMVFAITLMMAGSNLFAEIHKISIREAQEREKIPDDLNIRYSGPGIPYHPNRLFRESPGIIVGTTYYDQQTNGSTGRRIAKHECGVHIAWMNCPQADISQDRFISYNFIDSTDTLAWDEQGIQVSTGTRAGYANIALRASDGAAIIAYHENADENKVAVDAGCGLGLFAAYQNPNTYPGIDDPFLWPYVTYDGSGRIHIINAQSPPPGYPEAGGHAYSVDGGANWSNLAIYDTLMDLSGIITSSPVSNKVAIVATHPKDLEDPNQYNNDVIYIESVDGETWNYNQKVNITDYRWEDTIRAYTDVSACYDYNDNLHILWSTPYYNADSGFISDDACLLWHWSEETGINLVHNAWYPSIAGTWNRSACKMSISSRTDNALYALWTHFDTLDVSAQGYSNGDLYLSYSVDGGQTWSEAINVTNTFTPDCGTGDCESEHWSTMAENVPGDGYVYIQFIEDKDPGSISKNEGFATENPVRFLKYPDPTPLSVPEDGSVPSLLSLSQNYPNPFNSSTNIGFALNEPTDVHLVVYNILGEEVVTLAEGRLGAGWHKVTWDASQYPSGIYLYRLKAGDHSECRRMTLLK